MKFFANSHTPYIYCNFYSPISHQQSAHLLGWKRERTMQVWVQSLFYSVPMAVVDCQLGKQEFQQCRKQAGWRSAEFFSILGTWCMPLICHHQQCFCEFLPQWLSLSCARTAFPFSFSTQYSHPVIF